MSSENHRPILSLAIYAMVLCVLIVYGQESHFNVSIQELSEKVDNYHHGRGATGRALKGKNTDKSLSSSRNNEIYQYLAASEEPHKITLVTWNPDGTLGEVSPVNHPKMFPANHPAWLTVRHFNETTPSQFGTVALALGSDHISAIPWHLDPPVPLFVYTLLDIKEGNPMYKLIPTPYEWVNQDQNAIQEAEEVTMKIPFNERINKIVWRGYKHLGPEISRIELDRLGSEKENKSWLNAKLLDSEKPEVGHLNKAEMSKYKYQIDVGGKSGTTWGALRWKMCSGNLVFKVDTFSRDWWHDQIIPWEHYIPVDFNLTDLHKQYQWAESHPRQAQAIAQQGRLRCLESATNEAVEERLRNVMQSLPPASKRLVDEAKAIINGLGSFYDPILARSHENKNAESQKTAQKLESSPVNVLLGELSELKSLENSITAKGEKSHP